MASGEVWVGWGGVTTHQAEGTGWGRFGGGYLACIRVGRMNHDLVADVLIQVASVSVPVFLAR